MEKPFLLAFCISKYFQCTFRKSKFQILKTLFLFSKLLPKRQLFAIFWSKTAKYPLLGYTAQFLDNLRYYFHFSVKNCQKYSIQNQNLRPLSHSQGCYGHLKMLLNLVQKGAKIRILAIFWFLRCLLC